MPKTEVLKDELYNLVFLFRTDEATNIFPSGCELQMKILSTIMSILFGLFNVYSDILLAYTLFKGTFDPEKGYTATPQPYFGLATLIFPIIRFFGTCIYWWRHEEEKTISCLFLLFQLYPAFSHCRILILLYNKNPNWVAEMDRHEQKLSLIGM